MMFMDNKYKIVIFIHTPIILFLNNQIWPQNLTDKKNSLTLRDMRKSFIVALLLVLLVSPTLTFAESDSSSDTTDTTPSPTKSETKHDVMKERKDAMEALKNEKKEALQTLKDERKTMIKTTKEAMTEKRKELKEQMEENREAMKEKFKAQREAFKEKLETIKDEKKKMTVEKVDARLLEINKNRTDRMAESLTKLKEILAKITEKAGATPSSALSQAITSANTAITTAETAVAAQAGKEYVATITTESTLRQTVGTVMSQLQKDLQTTNAIVITAKKAVRTAGMELAKQNGELMPSLTPSPSVSVTPTETVTVTQTP